VPNQQYVATAHASQKPPYVEAYALLVLLLALLITAIVVAAAVMASYRRIGVLKSIGFTPAQIVASYLAQLAVPAVAGAAFGTVVGSDWAVPLINGGPLDVSVGVPLWIKLAVPVAVCALVALAGLIPAVRAVRLTAVRALAAGQSPRTAGSSRVAGRVGRLPLPRPVALGIASAFSRPGASLAMAAVIAMGLTGAVLAVGLNSQMLQLVVGASCPQQGGVVAGQTLVRRLTVLVAMVAGLGVLSPVLMLARQRVHDLGVCKAIGMTPRQIVTMITCRVLAPGLAAAAVALLAGIALEHAVARAVVSAQSNPLSQVILPAGAGGTSPRFSTPAGHLRVVSPTGIHGGRRPTPLGPSELVGLPDAYKPRHARARRPRRTDDRHPRSVAARLWAAASKTTTALRAE